MARRETPHGACPQPSYDALLGLFPPGTTTGRTAGC